MLILLWGLSNDPILSTLSEHLAGIGAPTILLDQRDAPASTLQLEIDPAVGGTLVLRDRHIELAEVTAVNLRPHDSRRIPAVARAGVGSEVWARALAFDQAVLTWLELTPALVVNRPSAMAANGSKPFQLMRIQEAGFRTPETLVTTDPAAVAAFRQRHGEVIYKSVSGVRSKVARFRPEHAGRLPDVVWCPTQFQRYIAGREYRVHVVADAVFACEVVSDADDYRYVDEGGGVEILSATLPPDIADRCRSMARLMGLNVTGIDLRHGTDGEWYCLEANPAPAFTYFEQATGQPIAATVARLLAGILEAGDAPDGL
jgi:glutathione synthase/RimK-type ligase-like ATP-grasp enzyme